LPEWAAPQPEALSYVWESTKPYSAASFVDSIGVAVHFGYTKSPYYRQWKQVCTALIASGIKHFRDGLNLSYDSRYSYLAKHGIGMDVVTDYDSTTTQQIGAMLANNRNIDSFEASNEKDNTDPNWLIKTRAWQPKLFMAVKKASPSTIVLGPSLVLNPKSHIVLGNQEAYEDGGTIHAYYGFRAAYNPETPGWWRPEFAGTTPWSTDYYIASARQSTPTKPIFATETGYTDRPFSVAPGRIFPTPDSVSAKYLPRTLLWHFMKGIARTYIYELVDESQFGPKSGQAGFGLLRGDLSSKPSMRVITSLIRKLSDTNPPRRLVAFPISLAAHAPADVTSILLEKSDGHYAFVVWRALPCWSTDTFLAAPVAIAHVTLRLDKTRLKGRIVETSYDDSGNDVSVPLAVAQDGTLTVAVRDSIEIFDFFSQRTVASGPRRTAHP
jgi:hypothetical protein